MTANETNAPLKEFVISRVLDAPRERVWRAWTEVEHLAKWFGPKGTVIISAKNDLHPGGIFHYGMKGPDGEVMWGKWTYKEIAPPSKLVLVNSFSDEAGGLTRHPLASGWPLEMLTTATLEEKNGGKTLLTVRWIPINPTDEERKTFMAGFESMKGGWTGTMEQLEAYLRIQ